MVEHGPHDGDLCILFARQSAAGEARREGCCAAADCVGRVGYGARQADEEAGEGHEAPSVGADVVSFEVIILHVLVRGRAEPWRMWVHVRVRAGVGISDGKDAMEEATMPAHTR